MNTTTTPEQEEVSTHRPGSALAGHPFEITAHFQARQRLEEAIFELDQQMKSYKDLADGLDDGGLGWPAWLWILTKHTNLVRDRFYELTDQALDGFPAPRSEDHALPAFSGPTLDSRAAPHIHCALLFMHQNGAFAPLVHRQPVPPLRLTGASPGAVTLQPANHHPHRRARRRESLPLWVPGGPADGTGAG